MTSIFEGQFLPNKGLFQPKQGVIWVAHQVPVCFVVAGHRKRGDQWDRHLSDRLVLQRRRDEGKPRGKPRKLWCTGFGTLIRLMAEIPNNQLRLVVYPTIYRVSYIPGGAGFQPSTVGFLRGDGDSPNLPMMFPNVPHSSRPESSGVPGRYPFL